MNNYTIEQLLKLIYEDLEKLGYEIVLNNPTSESTFPCIVLETPLESVSKTYNTEILMKRYQISIQCWDNSKYKIMKMVDEIDQILIERNIVKTNTTPDIYDDITKKYRIVSTYEVKYNGLTNAFQQ